MLLLLVPTAGEAAALLDGPVPVDERAVATRVDGRPVTAALCGFGPAAAGVLATIALGRHAPRPPAAVLAGLAGTYAPDRLPVGGVLAATSVRMGEVGRGSRWAHLDPVDLDLPQAPGRAGAVDDAVFARLEVPMGQVAGAVPGELVTVPWSASSPVEAEERRYRFGRALAEDMEGFPVALAARRLGVPLAVLRGVSNVAGAPRGSWATGPALEALRSVLASWLAAPA